MYPLPQTIVVHIKSRIEFFLVVEHLEDIGPINYVSEAPKAIPIDGIYLVYKRTTKSMWFRKSAEGVGEPVTVEQLLATKSNLEAIESAPVSAELLYVVEFGTDPIEVASILFTLLRLGYRYDSGSDTDRRYQWPHNPEALIGHYAHLYLCEVKSYFYLINSKPKRDPSCIDSIDLDAWDALNEIKGKMETKLKTMRPLEQIRLLEKSL